MATASSLNLQQQTTNSKTTGDQIAASSFWIIERGFLSVAGNDIRLFIWISILVSVILSQFLFIFFDNLLFN